MGDADAQPCASAAVGETMAMWQAQFFSKAESHADVTQLAYGNKKFLP